MAKKEAQRPNNALFTVNNTVEGLTLTMLFLGLDFINSYGHEG